MHDNFFFYASFAIEYPCTMDFMYTRHGTGESVTIEERAGYFNGTYLDWRVSF